MIIRYRYLPIRFKGNSDESRRLFEYYRVMRIQDKEMILLFVYSMVCRHDMQKVHEAKKNLISSVSMNIRRALFFIP